MREGRSDRYPNDVGGRRTCGLSFFFFNFGLMRVVEFSMAEQTRQKMDPTGSDAALFSYVKGFGQRKILFPTIAFTMKIYRVRIIFV